MAGGDITRDDINKIYEKLDGIITDNTSKAVALARIEEKIEAMPAPPSRPCEFFQALKIIVDNHLREAVDNARDWKQLLFGLMGELLKYGAIAAIGVMIGRGIHG